MEDLTVEMVMVLKYVSFLESAVGVCLPERIK